MGGDDELASPAGGAASPSRIITCARSRLRLAAVPERALDRLDKFAIHALELAVVIRSIAVGVRRLGAVGDTAATAMSTCRARPFRSFIGWWRRWNAFGNGASIAALAGQRDRRARALGVAGQHSNQTSNCVLRILCCCRSRSALKPIRSRKTDRHERTGALEVGGPKPFDSLPRPCAGAFSWLAAPSRLAAAMSSAANARSKSPDCELDR